MNLITLRDLKTKKFKKNFQFGPKWVEDFNLKSASEPNIDNKRNISDRTRFFRKHRCFKGIESCDSKVIELDNITYKSRYLTARVSEK